MALILNGSDTSAGDDAGLGYTSAEGLILTGQGSTSDVTIKNDADATVLSIPTGTTNVGIGTTSPAQKLELYNAGFISAQITSNSSSETQLRFATNTAGRISNQANTALIFDTNATERMRIDSSGKVGIGATGNLTGYVNLPESDYGEGFNWFSSGTAANRGGVGHYSYESRIYYGSSDNLTFVDGGPSGTERMRIAAGGNVGIGTNNPTGKLTVSSDIDVLGSNFANVEFTGASVNGSGVYTGLDSGGGYVVNVRDSGYIGFSTTNAERMRIDASGNLLVGTTNTSLGIGNTNTGFQVENNGTFLASRADNIAGSLNRNNDGSILSMRRSGNEVGTIGVTSSSTSYNTSSDYRLKENVSYTFDATTRLKQLKPARFNFISDADKTVDGFLAHEVSSIVPEAITGTKDAVADNGDPIHQCIDQSKLVPLLVKTIQELEARITALEAG